MKLKEFEGKKLFEEYGIPIPKGYLVTNASRIGTPKKGTFMVKAQISAGGRGKAGLILKAKASDVRKKCKSLFKHPEVNEVLVEEALKIKKELYVALTIDRNARNITLLFSKKGGVDVEDLDPKSILQWSFFKYKEKVIQKKIKNKKLLAIIGKMMQLMQEKDALLVEINPLVITKKNDYIAADSKVVLDSNALFKHMEFDRMKYNDLTRLEKTAAKNQIIFVQMKGDIAVIGNGAGLVMNTLDLLHKEGLQPADFLDVGGGAEAHKVKTSLEIVAQTKPKIIFLNMFGGITDCLQIAEGVKEFLDENNCTIPIVARIVGTNAQKARKLLQEQGVTTTVTAEDGLKKLQQLLRGEE